MTGKAEYLDPRDGHVDVGGKDCQEKCNQSPTSNASGTLQQQSQAPEDFKDPADVYQHQGAWEPGGHDLLKLMGMLKVANSSEDKEGGHDESNEKSHSLRICELVVAGLQE